MLTTRNGSVDDILTLSKLDSSLLAITPTAAQPVKVTQDALKVFEGEVRTAEIAFTIKEDEYLANLGIDWVLLDLS